ncbi:hypothetical protein ACFQ34_08200 [Pseudonocardia benzenivorans]|uniref:Uncharacterized protein n=1 Tax=Pseudonocardia benzenivorans TaxID=228005 RepID=A0ABW3VDP2_9PSEU
MNADGRGERDAPCSTVGRLLGRVHRAGGPGRRNLTVVERAEDSSQVAAV